MSTFPAIDIAFDFRSDSTHPDPDKGSPTLRHYHELLWSKTLSNGALLKLNDATPGAYLHHKSDLGEFSLSSDSLIPTFSYWKRLAPIIEQISTKEQENFSRISYTIGGMIVFPSNQIGGKQTINAARGRHPRIADRFDLTLESIRRYYLGDRTGFPIADTLLRYSKFFDLFGDFRGYVDFFLLQDLATDDYCTVRFFLPFAEFQSQAVPGTLSEYQKYRQSTIAFVESRNQRIFAYSNHSA